MSQHKISQTEYSRSNAYSEQSYYDMMRIPESFQQEMMHEDYHASKKETLSYDVPKGIEQYTHLYNKTKEGHSQEKSTSEIFSYIQNPVDYDQMDDWEIKNEREELEEHLKFLNEYLNNILKKHIIKHTKQEKKNHKKLYNDELSRPAQQKTAQNNMNLIKLLENQHKSLMKKLSKFQSCAAKFDDDCLAISTKQEIRKIKLDIIERKRKLVLNEKKIANKDSNKDDKDKHFFDLQQQYMTYSKKRDKLNQRLDQLASENDQLIDQQQKITHKLEQKNPNLKQLQLQKKNQLHQQHLQALYATHRRKLQLQLRKREREEEEFKRKYYNLLKSYEKAIENSENLDGRIKEAQRNIMKHNFAFLKKKKQITESDKSESEQEEQERSQKLNSENPILMSKESKSTIREIEEDPSDGNSCIGGFMLTELNPIEKSKPNVSRISKRPQKINSEKQINQQSKMGINSQEPDQPKSTKFHIRKKYKTEKVKTEHTPGESSSNIDSMSIIRKIEDANFRGQNRRQWTQENRDKRRKKSQKSIYQNQPISKRNQLMDAAQLQKLGKVQSHNNRERSKRIRTEVGIINHQKVRPANYNYTTDINKSEESENVSSLYSKLKEIVNENSEKEAIPINTSQQQESSKLKGSSQPIYFKSEQKGKPLLGEGIQKISSENYDEDFFEEESKKETKMRRTRKKEQSEYLEEEIVDNEEDSSYNADFDNFSP